MYACMYVGHTLTCGQYLEGCGSKVHNRCGFVPGEPRTQGSRILKWHMLGSTLCKPR